MTKDDKGRADSRAAYTRTQGNDREPYRRRRRGSLAHHRKASPLTMARRTCRRAADTDWTRSYEHLPTMRSAGNLRLPRQEHRLNDLVLHHSPARSVLGRRTARPEHQFADN